MNQNPSTTGDTESKKTKWLRLLKQPSTYRGIALVLGVLGVGVAPALITEIGSAVAGVIAVIEMVRDEDAPKSG